MFMPCPRFPRRAAVGLVAASLVLVACGPCFALAAGTDPYNAATNYKAGDVVLGSDGNAYRAAAEVKGRDPVTSGAGGWRLAFAARELVLDVPGRFTTIAESWEFLDGARIAESAKVVIEIAPETYEQDGPLVLDHSEGVRIVLRGKGEKPEDCVVSIAKGDGIVVNGGKEIQIENLTVSAKTPDKGMGLILEHGSSARIRRCRFVDFAFGAFVNDGSRLRANDCEFVTKGNKDCVTVRSNADAIITDCKARANGKARQQNGFVAYNGGAIECFGCSAEGWYSGFNAYGCGAMHLERCTGRENKWGASTWYSSSANVIDCTFAANEGAGVGALFATMSVIGCTLTGNDVGVVAVGNGFVSLIDKPTKISGGTVGIRTREGGRVSLSMKMDFARTPTRYDIGGGPADLPIEQAIIGDR
jgi:hypothetical protein